MIDKLFPARPEQYTGRPIAKWFFILITIVTIARSLIHILAPDGGAQSIATIPLDSFSQSGAETGISMFAFWGLSQLLIGLLYVAVLCRYPGLIPLMYLSLLIEYGARILIGLVKSIQTTGTAPGVVGNFIFIPLALVMLILSLQSGSDEG